MRLGKHWAIEFDTLIHSLRILHRVQSIVL
jgi:hypothetical protein